MKQPIERLFRWSTSLVAVALLALALPAAAQQKKPVGSAQGKPNILVIWGDDIGYWNVSAYNQGMMGYRTPNIDRIAKEGALFTDWYGQQSCTAGRAAFITGQSGFRTGLLKVGLPGAKEGLQARDVTLAQLLKSIGGVAIMVGTALTILDLFVNIGPLLAGVGVAGLAVSFGAQSLVKDVISGFFILLENQFGVGDIIEVNGVGGVVERMTMRVVMLRDVHGVLHVIPNGSITMVSNRTRGWSRAVLVLSMSTMSPSLTRASIIELPFTRSAYTFS